MPRKIKISNQEGPKPHQSAGLSRAGKKSSQGKQAKSKDASTKARAQEPGSSDKSNNNNQESIHDTNYEISFNYLKLTKSQIQQNLNELKKTADYLEIKNLIQNPFIKAYKKIKKGKNRNIKNNKRSNIRVWRKESRPYFYYLNPKRFNCLSNEDQSIVIQSSKPYYYRKYLQTNFLQKITKAFSARLEQDREFIEKFCLPFEENKQGEIQPNDQPGVICSIINVYEACRECKISIFDGSAAKKKSPLKEFGLRFICLVKSKHSLDNLRINPGSRRFR